MPEHTSFMQRVDRVLVEGREFVARIRQSLPPPPPEREHTKSNSPRCSGSSPSPTSKLKKQQKPPRI